MNGWTPKPRNIERIEHDRNQQEIWQAATLAYLFEQENRPTEAEADELHELIVLCNIDQAHINFVFGSAEWFDGIQEVEF